MAYVGDHPTPALASQAEERKRRELGAADMEERYLPHGVTFVKAKKKNHYEAYFWHSGKPVYVGMYPTPDLPTSPSKPSTANG